MHDVDHAMANLREITQMQELAFNEHGYAELIFDDAVSVDIIRIDDVTLELSTTLARGEAYHLEAFRRLLSANYLGDGVGAGRIGYDMVGERLVYCERIPVKSIDAWSMEERFMGFLRYVAFWKSKAADAYRNGASKGEASSVAEAFDTMMIRI